MTLYEISKEYRVSAAALRERIQALERICPGLGREEQLRLDERLRVLNAMWRETCDVAVLCERYYERGYRRNGRYTI